MKFDTPATTNPIDQLKVVGKPTDRIDGPLKTTGTAPYAYERHDVVPNQAYGYIVGSAIAKGRIARSTSPRQGRARRARHRHGENAGKLGKGKLQHRQAARRPRDRALSPGDRVVVAETFEQARAAAQLVRVDYVRAKGAFDLAAAKDTARSPSEDQRRPGDTRSATSPARSPPRRSARRDLHDARRVARDDGAARRSPPGTATSSRSGPRTR
jgi:xanthine dehydrogenase YagR molybdenum-binding subunit